MGKGKSTRNVKSIEAVLRPSRVRNKFRSLSIDSDIFGANRTVKIIRPPNPYEPTNPPIVIPRSAIKIPDRMDKPSTAE